MYYFSETEEVSTQKEGETNEREMTEAMMKR